VGFDPPSRKLVRVALADWAPVRSKETETKTVKAVRKRQVIHGSDQESIYDS
jgi:hypothetical protein